MANYTGVFVCSAGNGGTNNDVVPHYPSNVDLPNVIAVGSCDLADKKSETSSYGQTTVDLFAPGVGILTTTVCQDDCTESGHDPDGYHTAGGTSIAAPFVAGVAALLLSKYPDLSACEIKDTIISNVDLISDFTNICVSGGRLNAYQALNNVQRHTFTYENTDNEEEHKRTCVECSFSDTAGHSWTYTSTGSLFTHKRRCSHCSYSDTENHNWLQSLVNIRCTKCRFVTDAVPVQPTKKQDVGLENINFVLFDDFEKNKESFQ